eukprot:3916138-Amphidinium_carterae.1
MLLGHDIRDIAALLNSDSISKFELLCHRTWMRCVWNAHRSVECYLWDLLPFIPQEFRWLLVSSQGPEVLQCCLPVVAAQPPVLQLLPPPLLWEPALQVPHGLFHGFCERHSLKNEPRSTRIRPRELLTFGLGKPALLVRTCLGPIELCLEASVDRSLVVSQSRLRLSPLASQE